MELRSAWLRRPGKGISINYVQSRKGEPWRGPLGPACGDTHPRGLSCPVGPHTGRRPGRRGPRDLGPRSQTPSQAGAQLPTTADPWGAALAPSGLGAPRSAVPVSGVPRARRCAAAAGRRERGRAAPSQQQAENSC